MCSSFRASTSRIDDDCRIEIVASEKCDDFLSSAFSRMYVLNIGIFIIIFFDKVKNSSDSIYKSLDRELQ